MKKFKSILAAIVTIGAVLPVSAASVDYGYCADEPAQYGASALSTTNYAVIQIPAEIAAKYAGASITGVKLLCQTYTLNDVPVNTVNAFVVEDFDNFAPVLSKEATVEGKVWDSVKFDESYTITGDKDIYVGYSMKANRAPETMPIAFDAGPAVPYGDIAGYSNNRGKYFWEHAGDSDYGNVLVRAIIEGDNLPGGELKVLSVSGIDIVKPGEKFSVSGSLFNSGAVAVDSYTLSCRFDGKEIASKAAQSSLAPGSIFSFTFDNLSIEDKKEAELTVVAVVDGKDVASASYTLDCTDAMLPRKVLIEEFTTAQCGKCPAAHRMLSTVSADRDDMIVVAHHSGFGVDNYTTTLDQSYLWFYQISSWAPAFMMDRVNFADQGAVAPSGMSYVSTPGPVLSVSSADELEKFVNLAADRYAWLDVNIDYTYDADTRKLDVEVSGTPVKTLDEWTNPAVSVFLVERSDVSYQSGVSGGYTHRHIFRESLTGDLGQLVELKKGEPYSCKVSSTIDEKLDAADLDIVAFVGNANGSDANDCKVFNAASVAIDTPSTGIDAVTGEKVVVTGGDGVITVSGTFSQAAVYALNGAKVAAFDEAGSVNVAAGVYLVKVTTVGEVNTRKVVVK